MAAVFIPPSPHQVLTTMTNRRIPLANNPNATNSPLRAVAAIGGKRQRAPAADQREAPYGQPPTKKQIIEADESAARRPAARRPGQNATPFLRKLEAARDTRTSSQRTSREAKSHEDVRLWREHYKRIFPSFVFYFEGLAERDRREASYKVRSLGAREEMFFSSAVTHVVTTRNIPKAKDLLQADGQRSTVKAESDLQTENRETIDPSLLSKGTDTQNIFDVALQKKQPRASQHASTEVQARRQPGGQGDVLAKAIDYGMKVWAMEKLQRMLDTLVPEGDEEESFKNARGGRLAAGREADLSQLLKKEKLTGPADRDVTVATQEMVPLRGSYVYVYDMDEKTRPVMVRDYTTPAAKEDGKWPQFRNTGAGKCPFVEDPGYAKKQQQIREAQRKVASLRAAAPRTRAASAALELTQHEDDSGALVVRDNNLPIRPMTADSKVSALSKPLEPPRMIPAKRSNPDELPPMFNSAQANRRPAPKFAGGQPVASGVQPSNITSAIRSQIVSSISSTAAMPGAPRGATSKEVLQLKRKVFERTSAPSINSMGSSYINDVRAAINNDRSGPTRIAKRKAQENLVGIREDSEQEEMVQRTVVQRKRSVVERDPKPGYCENCREKFEDFEKHVETRKHKKFGIDKENWKELDSLLAELVRPLKQQTPAVL